MFVALRCVRSSFCATLFNQFKPHINLKYRFSSTTPLLRKPKLRQKYDFTKIAMLIFPATAFGLGTWQIQRRQWKLNLIAELEKCLTTSPIDLPENLDDLKNLNYRKVKITGKFDHSRELYIGPRSPITKEEKSGKAGKGLLSSPIMGVNGYFVVTPFIISGRNVKILVNRGWVSRQRIDPSKRPEGQIEDEVTITAVVRDTEKRPPMGMKNDVKRGQFFHRDVEQMAELLGTSPIFVDADISSTVPGGPIGGQTTVSLRNEHMNYIITWYTLGALTTFLWYKKYVKR